MVNAAQYDVFIGSVSSPGTAVVRQRVVGTTFSPGVDLGIGRFQFWVQAISATNQRSAWSIPQNLRINSQTVIGAVQFHASSARPTFTWQSLPGAVSYELWSDNVSSGQNHVVGVTSVTGTSFIPAANLPAGIYRYQVRGRSLDGYLAGWSNAALIYVGPQAVAPLAPTFNVRPVFQWTVPAGVATYEISLKRNSAVIASPASVAGATWTPVADLSPGDYNWWIRPTLTNGVKGPWSLAHSFNVGGQPTVSPITATGALTTIAWTPVTGAARYNLFVRRDQGSQAVIVQSIVTSTTTQINTSAPGTYRIWVQAVTSTNATGQWSRPVSFVVASLDRFGERTLSEARHLATALLVDAVSGDEDRLIAGDVRSGKSADSNERASETSSDETRRTSVPAAVPVRWMTPGSFPTVTRTARVSPADHFDSTLNAEWELTAAVIVDLMERGEFP